MKTSPARVAAFDILRRIETEKAFSSVFLPEYEEGLSPVDKGLCHELTLGVLRRQIYLDRIVSALTGGKKLDLAVLVSLRLGLYQLKFLNKIPAYSAINESVELVRRAKKSSATALVNAVLQKATKAPVVVDYVDDIDRISVETSHPAWLVERWIGQLGRLDAEALCRANNENPGAAFRFTPKWKEGGVPPDNVRSEWVDGCYFAERSSDPVLRDLAARGEIYFQDEASQLVGTLVNLTSDERFLDVCASPGSKTTQIAASNRQPSLIVAGDLHWPRVKFLQNNCQAQGLDEVNIVQYDAEKALPFEAESFDSVLVDAPCSGTGTIRHNPEIRYFLDPRDFSELSIKQLRILANASKLIKPGGVLVYSTCSLETEENEGVAERFLAGNRAFQAVRPDVPAAFLTTDGFARTYPHRNGMDGFFIAIFERVDGQ